MRRALIVLGLLAGCSDGSYLVVTVAARPAVHDAKTLAVTLTNASASRTDTLSIGNHAFPLTFSVSAPGRTGDLAVAISALDENMLPVGSGSAMTTVDAKSASVMLDSTDFVVNTDPAMDQFLASGDYEAAGLQLGANSDGTWTVGFRDNCNQTTTCNILGRKLAATGAPVATTIGGDAPGEFVVSTNLADTGAYPAVASNGQTTVVLWDYYNTSTDHGIACRAIDASGDAPAPQTTIATDDADVVTVTALSNGNFAASWQTYGPDQIRSIIVKPDCTTVTAQPVNVSSVVSSTGGGPYHSHAASNNGSVAYVWIVDGNVHFRAGNNSGPLGSDTTLLSTTPQYTALIARVAPFGTGFAVVVRWGAPDSMGPGKIEVSQITAGGMVTGAATLITDQSLSDFVSGDQSFGVSTSTTGELLVTWHQCDAQGTPGTCDVFGRFVAPSGAADGAIFSVPTTTDGDQTGPSAVALQTSPAAFAVAWTDESHAAPDTQGKAVRARIVYPPGS